MVTQTTSGIKVSVETFFQPEESDALQPQFIFAYRVTITNESEHIIQVKKRHWHIIEADGSKREVEGEGVVGEQPLLNQGQSYTYISGCNLFHEIGKMFGTYTVVRISDGKTIKVTIPAFYMIVPYKLN